MATKWSKKKVNPDNINSGNEYEKGDRVSVQALNSMVESGLYSQEFAEALTDAPDVSEAGNVGTPTVSFVDNVKDGVIYKKFKFANIKGIQGEKGEQGIQGEKGEKGEQGATGAKIVSTVLQGQDANGGNIYKQTFDNGLTAMFTAPKGAKGDTGSSGSEYANTSETVDIDSVITLTSTSTLADLGTQILTNKTKTIDCNVKYGGVDSETVMRFCTLINTPFGAPLGRYIVRVLASSVRPTIEILYSYANWKNAVAIRYLCKGYDGNHSDTTTWWLSDWIKPASAVQAHTDYTVGSSTGLSGSTFWNNSQNPSQVTIIADGDLTITFQGTTIGTDIRTIIIYYHPNGSYDESPQNLAFDLVLISDSGICSCERNLYNVGFSIFATSGTVSYNYNVIA